MEEITSGANSILIGRGEILELTFQQIGNKLRLMELTRYRLDALGRGIQLLDPIRQRIHQLAWNYRVGFGSIDWDDERMKCRHCGQVPRLEKEPDPLDGLSYEQLGGIV